MLVQALAHSRTHGALPGLWHPTVGGYRVDDVEIVAAFDIDRRKVGQDLAEAIFAPPNQAPRFSGVAATAVRVQPGILTDELSHSLRATIELADLGSPDMAQALRVAKTDMLVNLTSSGEPTSAEAYATSALAAGAAFLNATPANIVTNPPLLERFQQTRGIVAGDDLLSQLGGTALHKGILEFLHERGIRVARSYQLDVGGGAETLNTIDEGVRAAKRQMKTRTIAAELPYEFQSVAGTTDYVDYMGNNRTSYFWLEGASVLGSPVNIDIYLKTADGANAVNVLLDVIRASQAARDRGEYGAPLEICGFGFKSPPQPISFREAARHFAAKYLA